MEVLTRLATSVVLPPAKRQEKPQILSELMHKRSRPCTLAKRLQIHPCLEALQIRMRMEKSCFACRNQAMVDQHWTSCRPCCLAKFPSCCFGLSGRTLQFQIQLER
jgi:hypothetical protein